MLVQKEMTSMEEKIVKVLNEMSAYLTIAQMKKLTGDYVGYVC